MIILCKQDTGICLPIRIKAITIDPITHLNIVKDLEGETTKGVINKNTFDVAHYGIMFR